MIQKLFHFFIVFLILTATVYILNQYFAVPFGYEDYWDHHGVFFLIFLSAFPRLTLLFSSVVSGGVIWWLGWLFAPRILVAVLATLAYWHKNPILVVISWLVAIGGESTEKVIVVRRSRGGARRFHPRGEVIDVTPEKP